jgi:uncharacterized membrane protein
MSAHLIGVAYATKAAAENALACLRELEHERALTLEDAAVAVRLENGKVTLDQARQIAPGDGLVAGGSLGLLLGLGIGVPVAGAIFGLAGGSGIAAFDRGIPDKSMRRLTEELEVGHAAVFALVKNVDWPRLRTALAPLGGEVLSTQVDDVLTDSLGGTAGPDRP